MSARVVVAAGVLACTAWLAAGADRGPLAPGARVWLHAHNCYPEEGRGADRLWRAVGAARGPVAIEQDLAWDLARRQPVLSHDADLSGTEPTLEDHFFRTVAPLLDRALQDGATATWPVMVLHLDFKTNELEHHAAVWALLQAHAHWLTTAPRTADERDIQPLTPGPLLVLTEAGDGQATAFHDAVPVGERLLLFGTMPPPSPPAEFTPAERMAAAVAANPQTLIPGPATNYRRWANHPWAVIEEGGPPKAGRWTAQDRQRLDALVTRAHELGLWIRFYTLNGHDADTEGWGDGYNFGARNRVVLRWQAAIDAGADFVATNGTRSSPTSCARRARRAVERNVRRPEP